MAAVWTVDATNVSEDEFTSIWYTVQGDDEAADMINSSEGEWVLLTDEPPGPRGSADAETVTAYTASARQPVSSNPLCRSLVC